MAAEGGNAGSSPLREELHRLFSLRPSLDTFCDEGMRLLVDQTGITGAAIFTYSSRQHTLAPLTFRGLDESATASVRASVGRTWDIPLRSIRNRRINVIDAAHENPFVPEAIKEIGPEGLTIASIPFYHANAAVGVGVLFSTEDGGFSDSVLRSASQGLRIFGAAIRDLPKTATTSTDFEEPDTAGTEQPNLLRGLTALKSELVRLNSALEESERQRANEVAERVTAQSFLKAAQQRSERAEQELSELREKQKRIPELEQEGADLNRRLENATELAEKAKTRVAELEETLADKSRDNELKASELAELRAKRTELERDLQRAGERAERHEKSAADLNAQLGRFDAIKSEAERLRSELEATQTAKSEAQDRITELERAMAEAEAARQELSQELDASKSALDSTKKERESLYTDALKSWERLEDVEKQQADLSRERENLATQNESNLQRIRELEAVRDTLEAEKKEQSAKIDQFSAQVATLEAQRDQLHEELERIRGESAQTISELREQIEQTDRDRTGLSQQIAALKRVEEERDKLLARVEELEGETRTTKQSKQHLEEDLAQLKKQAEQLDIEKGALEMRIEVLAESEQNLTREKNEATAQLELQEETFQRQLSSSQQNLEKKQKELDEALASAQSEAANALARVQRELEQANEDKERLTGQLQSAREDESVRDELLATAEEEQRSLTEEVEGLRREKETLVGQLESAKADLAASSDLAGETESKLGELEKELRQLREGELVTLRKELESVTQARAELEESLAEAQERHSLESVDLQDRLALAQQEKEELAQSLAEKDQLLQSAEHGLTAIDIDDDMEGEDDLLEIDRSGIPDDEEVEGETIGDVEPIPERPEAIVLLDDAELIAAAARELSAIGHQVTALRPEPDAAAELAQNPFACAAINLAAPSAWPTLRKMRNGAGVPHSPMIAYALGQNADKGFWLGPVDFATLPISETDINQVIGAMVPNLRRVIAMSHDFDIMEEVRAQMTAKKVSTAVVLDGRQVLDLVPTVKPQAAILHMSPNCTDVFRAVAGLRSQEETREIPILFLLDEEAQPREESFVTAGIRMLSGRGTLVPDQLPSSLATALGAFQPAGE